MLACRVGDDLDAQIAELRRSGAWRNAIGFGLVAVVLLVIGTLAIVYAGGWSTVFDAKMLGVGIAVALGGALCGAVAYGFARDAR